MGDPADQPHDRSRWFTRITHPLLMPLLALFTAFAVGAVIMLLSGENPLAAYAGLLQGAFGSVGAISRTLRTATPFILTGLSVAFAFKAGLFNIGASGQYLMGTAASVAVGVSLEGLPVYIHLPLALLAGLAGGALWGAIPGLLKVWRGAHEVITTIMLNYVASLFVGWLIYAGGTEGQQPGPLSDPVAAVRVSPRQRRCAQPSCPNSSRCVYRCPLGPRGCAGGGGHRVVDIAQEYLWL